MSFRKQISALSSVGFALIIFAAGASTAFAARSITSATLNGAATVTVSGGSNIALVINVQTTGTGNPAAWESTGWRIATATGAFTCINTPVHTTAGVYTATSTITAPVAAGTYNAYFVAYSGTNCKNTGNTNPSPTLTLKKAVIIPATPTISINPTTMPNGTVGISYLQTLTASTTATGTFTWSFSGSLPPGITLAPSTAKTTTLTGTPTLAGPYSFSITVKDGTLSSTRNYTVTIKAGTPPPTPTSTVLVTVTTVGGPNKSSDFNISLAAPGSKSVSPATFKGNASGTTVLLTLPNTTSTQQNYTVTETNTQPNYLSPQYGDGCTNQNVVAGGSAVCTITNTYVPPSVVTSTLVVNLTITSGTAQFSDFNLNVTNGTSTVFNGAAASTQTFPLTAGKSFTVTEATTTNSQNYSPVFSGKCSGTVTTSSATCAITNNLIPPVSSTSTPTSTTNLILNPSLTADTKTAGIPDSWNEGGWGTNTVAFNYPVTGVNGGTGANVTISAYTDGDAKWYFNNVFVTPGDSYTFTDSYNATITSYLVAQFTATDGTLSYTDIATLPATGGAWANTSQTITAPGNAAAVTIFHLIQSVGSLTTTNYSLAPVSNGTGSNLFPEGLVSLTFDDGWQSQYDNALPILQAANMKGSFYIISDGMLNAYETTFPSSDNPFNVATTTKATTWSQIYTDPTQHNFTFSDTYTATGPSTITVSYKVSGAGASSTVLGPLPAGTNATANFAFTLPVLNGPLTIVQAVTGANTLTATNPLVQQPIGYMDTNHVLAMQAAGEEIGDHTVNHCDLVAIDGNPTNTGSCAVYPPSSTTDQQQIDDARTALQGAGLAPVDTFAYPYGSGAGQSDIEADVAADGLIAARSVNTGYNTKNTDPYALLNQAVDATVTDPATIQAWINYAATNHVWLILTFHQVELSTSTITQNKETDATTAAMLQSTVTYLQQQEAAGKIDVDTVHNIMTQFMK